MLFITISINLSKMLVICKFQYIACYTVAQVTDIY